MGEIRRCGRDVAQVVVMSHDARFLRDLWEHDLLTDTERRCGSWPTGTATQLSPNGRSRPIQRARLRAIGACCFYHDRQGNPRDVVQKLRPVVETHMKRMAPNLVKIKGLGNMLGKIREMTARRTCWTATTISMTSTITPGSTCMVKARIRTPNPSAQPSDTVVGKVLAFAGALTQ